MSAGRSSKAQASHDDGHQHPHDHGHANGAHSGGEPADAGHAVHSHRSGLVGWFTALVRPHSHDAADSMDGPLESSAEGIRAVQVSLAALGVTALIQLVVVILTGSVALLADTIHNFSDALTALPLWIAFRISSRVPTRRYTYGYGRAEDLAGVFIVAMIALSAALAGYESVRRLLDPRPIRNVGVVIAAGVIGFAGNELVAIYRIRVGRKIGSAALVADGLHARTDGFTSLAVVAGALGVLAGYPLADPIVGLLITVAILFVLRGAATEIYRRLMDAVEPELVDLAENSLRAAPGVTAVESVRLRWIGHRLRAEIDVTVDQELSLVDGHAIAEDARHRLLHDVPRLDDATVHVNPDGSHAEHHAATAHHEQLAAAPLAAPE